MKTKINSLKNTARITGVLYLIIIFCGMLTEMFVRSKLIISGDVALTATNILNDMFLFRLGFVSDLIMVMSDIVVALAFYVLLKDVHKGLALLAAFFRLIQSSVLGLNLLNYFSAILLLNGDSYLAVFETDQINALVMLFLNSHTYGYLISGVFFGLSCAVLGYLFMKTNRFPNVLGVFLILASVAYLVDCFVNFLSPEYAGITEWMVVSTAVIAELSVGLYLLVKGIRTPRFG